MRARQRESREGGREEEERPGNRLEEKEQKGEEISTCMQRDASGLSLQSPHLVGRKKKSKKKRFLLGAGRARGGR